MFKNLSWRTIINRLFFAFLLLEVATKNAICGFGGTNPGFACLVTESPWRWIHFIIAAVLLNIIIEIITFGTDGKKD